MSLVNYTIKVPLQWHPQNEILCINLTKYVLVPVCENYKTFMKEIKAEVNKWRDSSYSQTGRLYIVKISVFPNLIYRFRATTSCKTESKVCIERQKT